MRHCEYDGCVNWGTVRVLSHRRAFPESHHYCPEHYIEAEAADTCQFHGCDRRATSRGRCGQHRVSTPSPERPLLAPIVTLFK